MNHKSIQIFEHEKLYIDSRFTDTHFKKIVQYNDKHGLKFFSVGYDYIVFKQYVGVIQIGNLVIEVLPKADSSANSDEEAKSKWQKALFEMLRFCKYIKLESLSNAMLKIRSASLADLYFESFVNEVDSVIHKGLIKKYRKEEGNVNFLKGKLNFAKNISKNIIHQERFFTEHQVYDSNHLIHQILKKALNILAKIATQPFIIGDCQKSLLYFENIKDIEVNEKTFEKIILNRKTEHYKDALFWAKMIILNYSPDLIAGDNNILAILFDMNKLFEKYVFLLFKKWEEEFQLSISGQTRFQFWENKEIKPDIVIDFKNSSGSRKRIIIDTKWKLLHSTPADSDLKQIYSYNLQLNAQQGILLYPKFNDNLESQKGFYAKSQIPILDNYSHSCDLYFIDLFNEQGKLDKDIGRQFLSEIKKA